MHSFRKTWVGMKKILCVLWVILGLAACKSDQKFKVVGEVSEAAGKMLYLEASALEGVLPLDSVKLKGSGSFAFTQHRPESPEFYRLRIEDKVINFSIDSTETVSVKAVYPNFATAYTVNGSPNSQKIKELTLKQMQLQADVNALTQAAQANQVGVNLFQDSLASMMERYKNDVKVNYIYAAPNTAAAYFALFQMINNYLIFDPLNNKEDIKCFAAVATSLNNFYPHADRSKNLYNIVIKGLKNTRQPQEQEILLPEELITETGIIDINLRDMKGETHKLSDLKGKVVLLDFAIYQSAASATHNYLLRDLYDKYAPQGLEIYQVSLDADEHYWKTIANNLPWICVRDPNGIYSTVASLYSVESVPSLFLVNRESELSARGENLSELETAVKQLL